MLIYYSCIERLRLLKSIWLFKIPLDYLISKIVSSQNYELWKILKLFFNPHNETTNNANNLLHIEVEKYPKGAASTSARWKCTMKIVHVCCIWNLYGYLITLFKNYWILMQSCIRIYFILCEKIRQNLLLGTTKTNHYYFF